MTSMKIIMGIVLSFAITTLFFIFVWSSNYDLMMVVKPFKPSYYMRSSTREVMETFNRTLDEKTEIIGENNIFFLETSSFGVEGIVLSSRQACSIESAANMNPGMQIYLLFLSDANVSSKTLDKLNILATYKNIAIRRISAEVYLKNTPVEEWWKTGIIETSKWPKIHKSDVLRLVTLWKFGGIYLDLEVIVMKSLENMTNFVVAEDGNWLGNAVLSFSLTGVGKKVVGDTLQDVKKNFRGEEWGQQGPLLITRVLRNLCRTSSIEAMIREGCQGFTVYPSATFYPLSFTEWQLPFDDKKTYSTMNKLNRAFGVHLWDRYSIKKRVKVGSQMPYAILASKYCPKIYSNTGEFF